MSRKILILGGTGTIGGAITRALLEQGEDVTLLLREGRIPPHNIPAVIADGNDEEALTAIQKTGRYDIVINLLIYTAAQAQMNLRVFSEVRQLIFISTVCVNDRSETVVFNEKSPCGNKDSVYGQQKQEAELVFLAAAEKGYPVTIIRPTQTYGGQKLPLSVKGKSYWGICQRILDGKPVIVHGDGSSVWVSTFCEDLASGLLPLIDRKEALGEVFQITSDELLTWNQMYQIIGEELGCAPKIVHIPTDVLEKAGLSGGIRGDKESSVVFDNRKLKELTGFTPKISFREGVRRYLAEIEKHPEWKTSDPVFDQKCDAVCAAWNGITKDFGELFSGE